MGTQILPEPSRIIGPLFVAAVVAIFGIGVGTWRLSDNNSRDIAALTADINDLQKFATKGGRCTERDCGRIESKLDTLRLEIDEHDDMLAHREAEQRLRQLERWMAQDKLIHFRPGADHPGIDLNNPRSR